MRRFWDILIVVAGLAATISVMAVSTHDGYLTVSETSGKHLLSLTREQVTEASRSGRTLATVDGPVVIKSCCSGLSVWLPSQISLAHDGAASTWEAKPKATIGKRHCGFLRGGGCYRIEMKGGIVVYINVRAKTKFVGRIAVRGAPKEGPANKSKIIIF